MSIIAKVGRRSFAVSTLIGVMYTLLTVGGISMVYPFLLMLATAATTEADMQEYRLIPAYFTDDNALYRKFLWLRYDNGVAGAAARDYQKAYPASEVSRFRRDENFGWGDASMGQAMPPDLDPSDPAVIKRSADLDRFLRESAALWTGEPLTETVTDPQTGQTNRRLVVDPHGRPVDPAGLTTGPGNMYRTVGYIGALFTGLSGPGRDEWPVFLRQFYADPNTPGEPDNRRLQRAIERHGRPYERWRQVHPGYDMPDSRSWSIMPGEYVQSDWLYYKAVWLTGAPVATISSDKSGDALPSVPAGLPVAAKQADLATGDSSRSVNSTFLAGLETEEYTDALGRTSHWTKPHMLRAVRPTQIAPQFAWDLKSRHGTIERFNLAMGLARVDWSKPAEPGIGRPINLTGRDVVAASLKSGPGFVSAYLLPPRIDVEWSRLTGFAGASAEHLARLNDWVNDRWVEAFRARGARIVHIEPFAQFEDVHVSRRRPIYQPLAEEWDTFVKLRVPKAMRSETVEFQQPGDLALPCHAWAEFLRLLYRDRPDKFRSLYLPGQNEADIAKRIAIGRLVYGEHYSEFDLAAMPIVDRDVVEFAAHKGELRRHFMFGNFAVVFDELVLEGRAMFNTIVLIVLVVLTHITINPLAAYALSRFRLTYTYKVLLFMLATMAFPPAVGMIPSFLLLKNFGLINTYAALVLPSIASGYTIFLLKGFFDALPQELYEAAEIDGAGRISTFLNVTFPLSKPIFAIIALGSFTAAYSGFMWAFLICPESKMWTIMVHLFNIQQRAGTQAGIAMAALVIAAIPTFLVFLFCQKVILKGIIVPSFK